METLTFVTTSLTECAGILDSYMHVPTPICISTPGGRRAREGAVRARTRTGLNIHTSLCYYIGLGQVYRLVPALS